MKYKVVVRDNLKEEFSPIPYPLYRALRKPVKTRRGGFLYVDTSKEFRFFNTKSEAKKALLANYKQNRGILTPLDLRNTKIVKHDWGK